MNQTEAQSFMLGSKHLDHPPLLPQAHFQGGGKEVKQSGPKLAFIWDSGIAGHDLKPQSQSQPKVLTPTVVPIFLKNELSFIAHSKPFKKKALD